MTGNVTNSSVLETCYLWCTAEPTELWYSSAVYTKEVTSLIFKITKPTLFDVYRAPNTRTVCFSICCAMHQLTSFTPTQLTMFRGCCWRERADSKILSIGEKDKIKFLELYSGKSSAWMIHLLIHLSNQTLACKQRQYI